MISKRAKLSAILLLMTGLTGVKAQTNTNAGTLTDIDGNVYRTLTIGNQTWMAENLKTSKYNDGTFIPLVTRDTEWNRLATPAYCWYRNDQTKYGNIYGALYNWYAINTGNLCPTGWHVPTDAEWTILTDYLGGSGGAGGRLKAIGTIEGGNGLWYKPNTEATNETGFTAVPGGYRSSYYGDFDLIGRLGHWWCATESSANDAWIRYMYYNHNYVYRNYNSKRIGFSVRCVRD